MNFIIYIKAYLLFQVRRTLIWLRLYKKPPHNPWRCAECGSLEVQVTECDYSFNYPLEEDDTEVREIDSEIMDYEIHNNNEDIVEYTLPGHWASGLINGDYSGYDAEEEEEIKDFLTSVNESPLSFDEDSYEFRTTNHAGTLPCQCYKYYFVKNK